MSPVVAVALLFFSVLSFATSGEAQDIKKEIQKVKQDIKAVENQKLELLKEDEANKKTCDENINKFSFEKSNLSAEINAEMKKAKELLRNITDTRAENEQFNKFVVEKIKSHERLVLLSKLWKEDLEILKKRRMEGSSKKCETLIEAVLKGAKRSKNNSDEEILLENELIQLKTNLSFKKSQVEVLLIDKSSFKLQCEIKIKYFQDAVNSDIKDLDGAQKLVKHYEEELGGLRKNLTEKEIKVSDLVGKILKENELLQNLGNKLKSHSEDVACYKHLEKYIQ